MAKSKSSRSLIRLKQKKQETFPVQVCYADKKISILLTVEVSPKTTISEAIELSGIKKIARKIRPAEGYVGIFSEIRPLDTIVEKNDRIEIYRPLAVSPRKARLNRMKKNEKNRISTPVAAEDAATHCQAE